jgi:hypothetical protein
LMKTQQFLIIIILFVQLIVWNPTLKKEGKQRIITPG